MPGLACPSKRSDRVVEKEVKHHIIHVEEKIDGTGGKIHGFVGNGTTVEIIEKIARLQNNRKAMRTVKELVDGLVEKQD